MAAFSNLLRRLEVKGSDGSDPAKDVNFDIRPLEPYRRTYGPTSFILLWVITGSFNIGGWTTGSSLIALGLNVWQAMLTVIIGNIIVGFLCVASGAPGAKWHIGFPIIQRCSWGTRGFIFIVIQRIFLACIWFSTQVYWGGQCVRVFLTALWPSFAKVDTPLADGTMTTGDFASFIIFTVLYLPLVWIKPEKYKIPFLISCLVVIPTIFVCLIWFTATARGAGTLVHDVSGLTGITQARGSHLGWMMTLGIRYARKPKDQILAQLVMVPLGTIVVALIGIICTSCAAQLFPEQQGTLLWAPYDLLSALQQHYNNSSRSRAAVAFASLSFLVAQFGMVVANNGVSAGIDLAALMPRFFTIRRGMLLMSALAFIVQPWQLLNGASKFLTVLGGYGVFLGPMTGVMFADYFILRKRQIKLTDLYENHSRSIYWYWQGMNWRALVAWAMGVWINVPGFAEFVRYGANKTLSGWSNLYDISYPLGLLLSVTTYVVLNKVSPINGLGDVDDADYFGTFGPAETRSLRGEEVETVQVGEGKREDDVEKEMRAH